MLYCYLTPLAKDYKSPYVLDAFQTQVYWGCSLLRGVSTGTMGDSCCLGNATAIPAALPTTSICSSGGSFQHGICLPSSCRSRTWQLVTCQENCQLMADTPSGCEPASLPTNLPSSNFLCRVSALPAHLLLHGLLWNWHPVSLLVQLAHASLCFRSTGSSAKCCHSRPLPTKLLPGMYLHLSRARQLGQSVSAVMLGPVSQPALKSLPVRKLLAYKCLCSWSWPPANLLPCGFMSAHSWTRSAPLNHFITNRSATFLVLPSISLLLIPTTSCLLVCWFLQQSCMLCDLPPLRPLHYQPAPCTSSSASQRLTDSPLVL